MKSRVWTGPSAEVLAWESQKARGPGVHLLNEVAILSHQSSEKFLRSWTSVGNSEGGLAAQVGQITCWNAARETKRVNLSLE